MIGLDVQKVADADVVASSPEEEDDSKGRDSYRLGE